MPALASLTLVGATTTSGWSKLKRLRGTLRRLVLVGCGIGPESLDLLLSGSALEEIAINLNAGPWQCRAAERTIVLDCCRIAKDKGGTTHGN
jgi:hypothetical protein